MTMKQARAILSEVAEKHGYDESDITRYGRQKHLFSAKAEAAFRMRREARLSLKEIARLMNVMDHTTVINRIKAHEKMQGAA